MVDANVNNDPEAARIVLNAGADLVLVGMDVTRRALLTEDDMREIVDKGDDAARTLMKITQFYLAAYKQRQPHFGGCPLSDPLAVAVCEDPSLVATERMFVDVELHGELSRGQVIPDRRHTSQHLFNADVAMDVDAKRFVSSFVKLMVADASPTPTGASRT